jgi:protein tyrosine phosphatase type 4A
MQKHKISHLVRVCDASYDVARVGKEGIEVKDWPFVDGDAPPDVIITQWLDLVTRMHEAKGVSNLLLDLVFFFFVLFFS